MDSQIRGMAVATRNANDAISFSQTTSGALSQISNDLQRMRELAVQAANGSNSSSDTALLNQEFSQLQTEVGRIQSSTNYNNVNVFQSNDIIFQVGANTTNGDRVNMQGTPLSLTQAIATKTITESNGATAFSDLSSAILAAGTASTPTITSVQNIAIDAVNSNQKLTYVQKNELLTAFNSAATAETATGATADSASSFATKLNTMLSSGVATFATGTSTTVNLGVNTSVPSAYLAKVISTAQAAPNPTNTSVLQSVNSALNALAAAGSITTTQATTMITALTGSDTSGTTVDSATNYALHLNNYFTTTTPQTFGSGGTPVVAQGTTALNTALAANPLTAAQTATAGQTNALSAITAIDSALTEVNTASAIQGALQNRFTAVISNLTAFSQSQTAAKSRIVDADFAAETAKLSKNQILQQAGTAMLAQANQLPSGILSLLKNG
jgi:flagellin